MRLAGLLLVILAGIAALDITMCSAAEPEAAVTETAPSAVSPGLGWKDYPPSVKIAPFGFETRINVTLHSATGPEQRRDINLIQLETLDGVLLGQRTFLPDDEIREAEFTIDLSKTDLQKARIVVNSASDGQISYVFNVKDYGEKEMRA